VKSWFENTVKSFGCELLLIPGFDMICEPAQSARMAFVWAETAKERLQNTKIQKEMGG
jgi:hypothetical protein